MYIEELKSSVNQLMANLESMPVSKGGEFKLQKLKRGHNTSIIDMGQEDENTLSKSDVVLSFTLEVGMTLHKTLDNSVFLQCFNKSLIWHVPVSYCLFGGNVFIHRLASCTNPICRNADLLFGTTLLLNLYSS